MSLFPEEIVEKRVKQYQARSASLKRSEEDWNTGPFGPIILELGFCAAFATGVVIDTIKASIDNKLTPRP
jgi:hypothetical protein